MPMSDYLSDIRSMVGHRLLTLPSVTGIVRNAQNELLLVRNSGDSEWTTPGGMIEPLESPSIAVVRELKEELNIDVEPVQLLGSYSGPDYLIHYPNGDQVVYVTCVFECRIIKGAPTPDQDELEACGFFSKEQIAELQKPSWLDDMLFNLEAGKEYN